MHWQLMGSTKAKALVFRVIAHVSLAAIAVSVPEVGPNRFWLAALLVGVGSPLAVLINLHVHERDRYWAEALLDLVLVVTLVHLVPHLWVAAFCLGLMVALAPSMSLHAASHWLYLGFGVTLLCGMSLALVLHNVEGWGLAVTAVAVTYPAMLYYTHTQMRRANSLREQADQLRGMTELAGSLAHDFNNTLMGISGHAELAASKLPTHHPAQVDLARATAGATSAGLLCGQLLNFSGRNLEQRERVDVAAELAFVETLVRPILPVGVVVHVEPSAHPQFIETNVSQLQQVLMNLMLNAGQSMAENPNCIEVSVAKIPDRGQDSSGLVRLSVRDRGGGIPSNLLRRVFDARFSTGTGANVLGLAGVRRIMEAHGGEVQLRARDGGGTEVLLTWPAAPAVKQATKISQEVLAKIIKTQSSQPTVAPIKAGPTKTSLNVLVVDDDVRIRKVLQGMLQQLGSNTHTVETPNEAIEEFRHNPENYDAILLDLMMPGMDGWTCLSELRSISEDTPVVICSGFNPNADMPATASADPNLSFLNKPFRTGQLAAALDIG